MAYILSKRLIGAQDGNWATGGTGAAETFTVDTSDGYTLTLIKPDASHLKFRTSQDGAPKSVEDLVDGGYDVNLMVKDIITKGPWVDARAFTTLALADAAAVAAGAPILVSSTWAVSADLTIASPVIAIKGASFAIATGKTLTINGAFSAGLYKVFTLTGTGTVVFGNYVPKVYPEWWGAIGNNTTDDGTAINAAAESARNSACKRISFPSNAGYASTTQVDLQELSVETAKITSSYAGPAVLVGDGCDLDVKLDVDRPVADWVAGHDGIHVYAENNQTNNNYFDFTSSRSAIGVKVQGPATSISLSYNTFFLREIIINKVGFMAHTPSGADGFCNENLVLNGNFGYTGASAECCIKLLGEGTYGIDKWTFIKPSFEYTASGDYACVFTRCSNIYIHDARMESVSTMKVAKFDDENRGIVVTLGSIGNRPIAYDVTEGGYNHDVDVKMSSDYVLHRLNDVSSFNAAYHDGTFWHVPGFAAINMTSGVVERKSNTAQFGFIDGHGGPALVGLAATDQAIGLRVDFYGDMPNDLTYAKKVYVKYRVLDDDQEGGLMIKCYNSAGAALSGNSPAYAQAPYWHVSGNHYYVSGSHNLCPLLFHKDVAYAYIGAYQSANKLTGLELYAPNQTDCYIPYTGPKELPGHLLAANAPTKWHFQVGDTVWNDTPVVGQPAGWMCIKRTDTTLASDGAATDLTIEVASITGIASGDIIGIKLDTGYYHFTTVNGLPAGTTVTLTAALPSAATTGNKVVANLWASMANLA